MTTVQHRRIWTEIAEAFETPQGKRSARQIYLTQHGLCFAYLEATDEKRFMCWPREWTDWFCYVAPTLSIEGDRLRATFAGLFAAMTYREWKQLFE